MSNQPTILKDKQYNPFTCKGMFEPKAVKILLVKIAPLMSARMNCVCFRSVFSAASGLTSAIACYLAFFLL